MYEHELLEWWQKVRPLCNEDIQSAANGFQRYMEKIELGRHRAEIYLASKRGHELLPPPKVLRMVQFCTFAEALQDERLNRFRTENLQHEKARGASAPENIERDLLRLREEARSILGVAETRDDFIRFIAGYAARLTQIQPFAATEQVALCVANAQVRSLLKQEGKLALDREHYFEGLDAAIKRGNLGPLAYALTDTPLTGARARSPFRMALVLHQGQQLM